MKKLRLSGFTRESVVDGPGIRAVVFAQGCPHHCPGCHNPETWDPEGGYELALDDILYMIENNGLLQGVTLTGGEPFFQPEAMSELAERIKSGGLDVVTYTGYTIEELLELGEGNPAILRLLKCTDILIDGPYRQKERDLSLAFRGSRNQRLIDVGATLREGRVVLWHPR